MNALGKHLGMTIRLYFRNPIALLYGYLFPIIFLVAFWVYYIRDTVPLFAHMGQLLAVTALSGVCFGLPTSLVAERERGVWRRYRLTPIPTASLVASTILARYFTTITTGLLQVGLAMAIGMPAPKHPFELFIAFTFVCWGFVGMGLVVSTMADTVPAVQALGQCLFLPLLMIGGVATPLTSLPQWAQHLSAFFPGRFAVEAMDNTIRYDGLKDAPFSLIALTVIGAAAVFAGTKLFRWDAMQKFNWRASRGWVGLVVASWILIGVLTEMPGRVAVISDRGERRFASEFGPPPTVAPQAPAPTPTPVPVAPQPEPRLTVQAPPTAEPAPQAGAPVVPPQPEMPAPTTPATEKASAPTVAATTADPTVPASAEPAWKKLEKVAWWGLPFNDLPPDAGVEAPLARGGPEDESSKDIEDEVKMLRANLPFWEPYKEPDPVQRIRNMLYVAVVPDAAKWGSERWVPWMIYEQLIADFPREDLIKMLTWIATHPKDGSVDAADQFGRLGLLLNPPDEQELRLRTGWYAMKFIGQLIGQTTP